MKKKNEKEKKKKSQNNNTLSADHLIAIVLASQDLEGRLNDTSTKTENQVKGRLWKSKRLKRKKKPNNKNLSFKNKNKTTRYPSGYCSQRGYGRPRAACLRRWGVADQGEFLWNAIETMIIERIRNMKSNEQWQHSSKHSSSSLPKPNIFLQWAQHHTIQHKQTNKAKQIIITFLVLDFRLDVFDGVGSLHLEGDGLAGQSLHEDLHSVMGIWCTEGIIKKEKEKKQSLSTTDYVILMSLQYLNLNLNFQNNLKLAFVNYK